MLFVGGNVVSVIMGMCMRSGQGSAVGIISYQLDSDLSWELIQKNYFPSKIMTSIKQLKVKETWTSQPSVELKPRLAENDEPT